MAKEKTIEANIRRALKQLGWWTMKIHAGPHHTLGVPDLLCIKNGMAVWLEVKQPGKQPTAIQRHRIEELRRFGCIAEAVHSVEEALEVIKGATECNS